MLTVSNLTDQAIGIECRLRDSRQKNDIIIIGTCDYNLCKHHFVSVNDVVKIFAARNIFTVYTAGWCPNVNIVGVSAST